MYPVKLDGKGRLKLPAVFQAYFKETGCGKFFVTTLDGSLLYIYPLPVWRLNEARLENATGTEAELEAAESLRFIANHFGEDVEPDSDWRLTIHQALRTELNLADKQVYMQFEGGFVKGYNETEHARLLEEAKQNLAGKLKLLKTKGFK